MVASKRELTYGYIHLLDSGCSRRILMGRGLEGTLVSNRRVGLGSNVDGCRGSLDWKSIRRSVLDHDGHCDVYLRDRVADVEDILSRRRGTRLLRSAAAIVAAASLTAQTGSRKT